MFVEVTCNSWKRTTNEAVGCLGKDDWLKDCDTATKLYWSVNEITVLLKILTENTIGPRYSLVEGVYQGL